MNKRLIEQALTADVRNRLGTVHVFGELDSTNSEAFRLLDSGHERAGLIVADSQTAGRGRHGRAWQSPAGGGLYMSLLHQFSRANLKLQGLGLVTALSVHQTLRNLCPDAIQLKWPNDLIAGKKKLAGILVESRAAQEFTHIVFGIGINYSLSPTEKAAIDRPVTGLEELAQDIPGREELAALISSDLLMNMERFVADGFAPFQSSWNNHDRYFESDIVIADNRKRLIGKSLGVDAEGSLILQTADGRKLISAGEIFPDLREADEASR